MISKAEDPDLEKTVWRLSMLRQTLEASKLASMSEKPLMKAYIAVLNWEDDPDLRVQGITSFDHALSEKLAKEVLPFLKSNAVKDPECAAMLASFYDDGIGVTKNPKTAFKLYLDTARKGHPKSMRRLAVCYLNGDGTTQNNQQALLWLEKASKAGDTCAMVLQGQLYEEGKVTYKSNSSASYCYEEASELGSAEGAYRAAMLKLSLAEITIKGKDIKGTSTYLRLYNKQLEEASKRGYLDADFHLGISLRCIGSPLSIKANEERSFEYYQRAAKSGLCDHLAHLACCYLRGWGCKSDPNKADQLLHNALAAAKREGHKDIEIKIQKVLSATSHEDRLTKIAEVFDWSPPKAMNVVANTDQQADEKIETNPAPAIRQRRPQLVLTDIISNPSISSRYYHLDGRIQNISQVALKSVKITVNAEDRAGRLITSEVGFVTPNPLPPGAIGTFSIMGRDDPRLDHVKVDFSLILGEAVPWIDRSGKNVHQ